MSTTTEMETIPARSINSQGSTEEMNEDTSNQGVIPSITMPLATMKRDLLIRHPDIQYILGGFIKERVLLHRYPSNPWLGPQCLTCMPLIGPVPIAFVRNKHLGPSDAILDHHLFRKVVDQDNQHFKALCLLSHLGSCPDHVVV